MSRVALLGWLLLWTGAACGSGHPPLHAQAPVLEARVQAELDRWRQAHRLPGVTAAYVLADGTVGVAASGLADVESQAPMTPRSRMLAASIGKSFVGATAIAIAREGRLDLDTPIATWLSDRPWFSRLPNHDTITLRHLLTHTAGLPDHVHNPQFARDVALRWGEPGNAFPPEALIAYVLDAHALAPAGAQWSYSDTGYILVGLILEQVVGIPYYEQVRQRFLEPLGLDATSPSDRRELPGLAAGYTADANPLGIPVKSTSAPGVMVWNPAAEWTGGGFVTTARDLAVWAHALYGGRALPSTYVDDLLRAVPIGAEDSPLRYGAGVAIQPTAHGPSYGHGGTIPGYSSSMRYYPAHRVAVAFQINTDVGVAEGATSAVSELEQRLAELVVEPIAGT